jgi:hypothetical protein
MRWALRSLVASGSARPSTPALAFLAVALALAIAACGGDGGGTAARETASGEVDAAEDAVVEVEDRPESTTSLAESQEASIRLPGGPDWLASHGGFVGQARRRDRHEDRPGDQQAEWRGTRRHQERGMSEPLFLSGDRRGRGSGLVVLGQRRGAHRPKAAQGDRLHPRRQGL